MTLFTTFGSRSDQKAEPRHTKPHPSKNIPSKTSGHAACFTTGSYSLSAAQRMVSKARRNVQQIVDAVASKLGNTRTVCKKYYIHPHILDSYETGTLKAPPPGETDEMAENGDLSPTERLVRDIILKASPQAANRS